jgi:hypothetical protein
MGKPMSDYSDLISAAEKRHRDRMAEAKAALVDAQWAAAAEYNVTGLSHCESGVAKSDGSSGRQVRRSRGRKSG